MRLREALEAGEIGELGDEICPEHLDMEITQVHVVHEPCGTTRYLYVASTDPRCEDVILFFPAQSDSRAWVPGEDGPDWDRVLDGTA